MADIEDPSAGHINSLIEMFWWELGQNMRIADAYSDIGSVDRSVGFCIYCGGEPVPNQKNLPPEDLVQLP